MSSVRIADKMNHATCKPEISVWFVCFSELKLLEPLTADNLSAHDDHKCTNATSCSYKLYSGMSLFTYALCMRIRINWEKTLSRLTIDYISLITSLSIYLINFNKSLLNK
ncbi:hypothetical protein GQX74_005580 [Glossina fuscipes]|nr:hypothetical protein GQX74_005580 [Glossina fuscipes]